MKDALFEAVFVVLGVVLALAANEWREHAQDQKAAARAYASIIEELKLNQQSMQTAYDYHDGILSEMVRRDKAAEPLSMEVFSRGYMRTAQLSRVAWDSASETGALSDMDYETVLTLGRVYARQDRYSAQSESTASIIYREIFDGGAASLADNPGGLGSLISASAYTENDMLMLYGDTLGGLQGGD